ncbi:hypothetical protein D210916BOD24_27780 [Alteromonas sp. D210916BOD_24]
MGSHIDLNWFMWLFDAQYNSIRRKTLRTNYIHVEAVFPLLEQCNDKKTDITLSHISRIKLIQPHSVYEPNKRKLHYG